MKNYFHPYESVNIGDTVTLITTLGQTFKHCAVTGVEACSGNLRYFVETQEGSKSCVPVDQLFLEG